MFTRFSFAAAVLVLTISAAPAQTITRAALPDAQLDALVTEALRNAPEMASAQANVEAAQRRIVPAQTLSDPFITTTWQNDGRTPSLGSAEGSFLGVMASQSVPWPGKLRLAGNVAASEAREIERGSLGRAALTLEARVRNAWYDLGLARAIDGLIDDRRTAATQIEASVRERYAAGLAVQQDVVRAQVELARLDEAKATQAATIANRIAELDRLIGAPQDRDVATPDLLADDAPLPQLASLLASVAARSPELAASQQAIDTGRARVELAKKNFLPDFTVSAGSMYRGNFEMGPMWQAGVGVSVPLWTARRQQNQLAEARAIVRGRTSDVDAIARELELRTRERFTQLDAARHIAALYRDKVLPLDEVSLESALASYQAAKVPFITVLDALNTLYGDRASYASRIAESAKWRVAIDEASLQPTTMTGAAAMPASAAGGMAQAAAPAAATNTTPSMNSMR
ncbi:MAG: TolC family protein [Acidobacteria bacterium]|nr:TolC family protein [Acidobacteriota bacterium]MBV9186785.1 TolC family protein [Acidobacteriota bacterium]